MDEQNPGPEQPKPKKPKGFAVTAAIDPEGHKEVARSGGLSVHRLGRAYQWDSISASVAGRKGGLSRAKKRLERQMRDRNKDTNKDTDAG